MASNICKHIIYNSRRTMDRLDNGLWYLFFSVYWTVLELDKNSNPKSNATGFMTITCLTLFSLLFHLVALMGFKVTGFLFFFICVVPGIIMPYIIFRRKKQFSAKFKDFEYLKDNIYRKKRIRAMIGVAISLMISIISIGILRNIYK